MIVVRSPQKRPRYYLTPWWRSFSTVLPSVDAQKAFLHGQPRRPAMRREYLCPAWKGALDGGSRGVDMASCSAPLLDSEVALTVCLAIEHASHVDQ